MNGWKKEMKKKEAIDKEIEDDVGSFEKPTENVVDNTVKNLLDTINDKNIKSNKVLVNIIANFLFSIGVSLENYNPNTSEEILMRYANNPTLGNALMAQSKHMIETWAKSERKTT